MSHIDLIYGGYHAIAKMVPQPGSGENAPETNIDLRFTTNHSRTPGEGALWIDNDPLIWWCTPLEGIVKVHALYVIIKSNGWSNVSPYASDTQLKWHEFQKNLDLVRQQCAPSEQPVSDDEILRDASALLTVARANHGNQSLTNALDTLKSTFTNIKYQIQNA